MRVGRKLIFDDVTDAGGPGVRIRLFGKLARMLTALTMNDAGRAPYTRIWSRMRDALRQLAGAVVPRAIRKHRR